MSQNEVHHLVVSAANAFAKYARARRDIRENPTQERQMALYVLRSDYHAKRDAVLAARGKKVVEQWGLYYPSMKMVGNLLYPTKEEIVQIIEELMKNNPETAIVPLKVTALVPV